MVTRRATVDLREGETAMNERSIFMEALELDDPRERGAHILRACGGDERLRARVEALLRRHQSDDGASSIGCPPLTLR